MPFAVQYATLIRDTGKNIYLVLEDNAKSSTAECAELIGLKSVCRQEEDDVCVGV